MTKVPVRGPSGSLDCPRCSTPLVRRKAPFVLRGEYVGRFESVTCSICYYSALTSSGYEEATLEARKLGLIGPPEESTITQLVEEKIEILVLRGSANSQLFSQKNRKEGDWLSTISSPDIGTEKVLRHRMTSVPIQYSSALQQRAR